MGLARRGTFDEVGSQLGDMDPAVSASRDGDLARATVLVEDSAGEALEMITARTSCGSRSECRSLWG